MERKITVLADRLTSRKKAVEGEMGVTVKRKKGKT
jgi:hypothetical protein